jgi:alcohol dehydrogenase class IV
VNQPSVLPAFALPEADKRWTANFKMPVEFGAGCSDQVVTCLNGARRVLVVTGRTAMKEAGVTQRLREALQTAGVESTVCDTLSAEPTYQEITAAAHLARTFHAQLLIGCGGGSAIDGAKAVAVAATHPGAIMDYVVNGPCQITSATLPILAISSTSGTGSHVGRVSVISDRERRIKRALISDCLYPRAAFCDPLVLRTMTPQITATTGFDAFAQALEGYLSRSEHPLGNLCAQQALAIIFSTLPRAIENGKDLDMRTAMAWADTLAGISLATNSIVTPHALSMVLGARYSITHGRAIAAVTVACLHHSRSAAVAKLAQIAQLLGCDQRLSNEAAADWALVAIEDWLGRIGMKRNLRGFGVVETDLGSIAQETRDVFALRLDADPLPPQVADLERILRKSMD